MTRGYAFASEKPCNRCTTIKPVDQFYAITTKCGRAWSSWCKECARANAREDRLRNPEKYKEIARKNRRPRKPRQPKELDLKKKRETMVAAYRAQPERFKEKARAWKAVNRHRVSASNAMRKAKRRNATPSWANAAYIRLWYEVAKLEERRLGVKCHVDHIIPISHPLVCGLHNEFNLQVLTESANCSKSNRFNVDDYNERISLTTVEAIT